MSRFIKGLLVGAIVGGVATLLTMKQNGEENRKHLAKAAIETSQDLQQLTSATTRLNHLTQQVQQTILPQTTAILTDIQETVTKFEQMNQPRLNRVLWRLTKLQDDFNRLQSKE